MKTNFYKSALAVLVAAGIATGCVNDDDYGIPNLDCTETNTVATIDPQDIPATSVVSQYMDNDIIEAYVTSSDEGGNFFKTISFQTFDGSFGFSVPVDATSTFVNFEPGRKVFIHLEGAYVDIYNSSLRIGAIFVNNDGEAQVGRIPETQITNYLERSCTVINEDDLVKELTITEALSDAHLHTLIELQNVQFTESSIGTTYYDAGNDLGGATNHYLTDSEGNTIIFRTSSFANFAGEPVAEGSGKVRGVLTKFGSDYQFMARTEDDIKLTEPRMTPIFMEDFQDAQDGTNFNFPGWVNFAESGSWLWREEAFSGNGYAEFSSFNSGAALNEAWLVTPAINLDASTGEALTFKVAQHHLDGDTDGNRLQVFIFTEFNGTDVLDATMVEITDQITLPTSATAWYQFVNSGAVSLDEYTGDIYIAFKFTGSGTNTALDGAFQVDDLMITGSQAE